MESEFIIKSMKRSLEEDEYDKLNTPTKKIKQENNINMEIDEKDLDLNNNITCMNCGKDVQISYQYLRNYPNYLLCSKCNELMSLNYTRKLGPEYYIECDLTRYNYMMN